MGIRIALAGNPNCGKTTMFNDLTGASQYVGNWPGVTVEKKEGKYTRDKDVIITDLPGVYSLSPYSPEEIVTRDYLLDGGPDVVVNLVDATNLERNLYLTTQILDLGVPVVVALNMMDLVKKSGDKIDVAGLSKQLGCPIVETTALKGHGMAELMETAVKAAKAGKPAEPKMPFDAQVEEAITKIEGILGNRVSPATARWFAIKLFEGEERTVANMKLSAADLKAVEAIREEVENKLDDDAESIITSERYNAITHVIDKTMKRSHKGMTTTQKIDRVVTNRWLGLPIFVVVMALVYYLAISVGTGVVTDWANDGISGDGFLYTGGAAYEEGIFAPLGFGDWQATVTSITGLVAKENVVATVGILTSLGDVGEADPTMWAAFAALFAGSVPAILAFCAFNLLCAPCFAAIGTIWREMGTAKWTWFTIGYMTIFAWCVGLMFYQFGGLLTGEIGFNVWTVVAIVVLAGMLFQIFRPMPTFDKKKDKVAGELEAEGSVA